MKKLLLIALALLLLSGSAQASILGSLLTNDSEEDFLEDESRGMAVNFDEGTVTPPVGDPFDLEDVLSVGDVIYGLVNIDTANFVGVGNPPTLVAIYALQVTAVDPAATGGPVLEFGPVMDLGGSDTTVANGGLYADGIARSEFSLRSILNDLGFSDAVLDAFLAPADWLKAGFVLLESAIAADPLNKDPAGDLGGDSILRDPANYGPGGPSPAYDLALVAGFNALNDHGFEDFYEVQIDEDELTTASLPSLRAQGVRRGFAEFKGGLSVLAHNTNANDFLGVGATRFDDSASEHDLTITEGGLDSVKSSAPGANPSPHREWMFTDNANFTINPTPEPASLLVWAGLMGGAGLMSVRRRRKTA